MAQARTHILAVDLGGTHLGLAILAHRPDGGFEPVAHKTFRSRTIRSFPATVARFLKQQGRALDPPVRQACVDFAGPVGPKRDEGFVTNLGWGFTVQELFDATDLEEITLLNDFEAVGYGLEVLLHSRPDAFVRISRGGKLPARTGPKGTAVFIGAGTGLGTGILVEDPLTRRYRPVPGEGGHADFLPVDDVEFEISKWLRAHRNHSAANPLDCEKIVSGPGLVNVFEALSHLDAGSADRRRLARVRRADPYDRPALIIQGAQEDPLCRKALDVWLCCYARAAKNSAIFPLAPGGVFLAGGIAARILPEIQSGLFMQEFTRCDVPPIRQLLNRTPVWIVTDYRIGLFGCANVAVNFFDEMGLRRPRKD